MDFFFFNGILAGFNNEWKTCWNNMRISMEYGCFLEMGYPNIIHVLFGKLWFGDPLFFVKRPFFWGHILKIKPQRKNIMTIFSMSHLFVRFCSIFGNAFLARLL